jgi:hypothetical protein
VEPEPVTQQPRTSKAYKITLNKVKALGAGIVSLNADDFGSKIQRSIARRITHAIWPLTGN